MGRTHHEEVASGEAGAEGAVLHNDGSVTLKPTAAPSSPQEGQLYYDSTAKKLKFYNGTAFETVTST